MCPLCHSKTDFFLAGENREYHLCPSCQLISVPEKFLIPIEDETHRYLEHENSLDNEGYVNMFLQKIEIVKSICPKIQTALDYGCGYEPVLQTLLNRNGYLADGYDPNFFPDGERASSYDLIISTETFEHFREPGNELLRIMARMTKGGYLAVMTRLYPKQNGLPCKKDFGCWYYKRDPTHIAFYCLETFSWIADHFCLEIVYINDFDFIVMRKRRS
jgi:hypothetical protein